MPLWMAQIDGERYYNVVPTTRNSRTDATCKAGLGTTITKLRILHIVKLDKNGPARTLFSDDGVTLIATANPRILVMKTERRREGRRMPLSA